MADYSKNMELMVDFNKYMVCCVSNHSYICIYIYICVCVCVCVCVGKRVKFILEQEKEE